MKDVFISQLNKIKKKECWGIIAGKGTGSIIYLNFGEKILRKKPLKNKMLSEATRLYDAEFSLFISCSWRLDSEQRVLCSSSDNHDFVNFLDTIIGNKLDSYDISSPGLDLNLHFTNSLSLKLFCDQTCDDCDENYSLHTPEGVFTVDKLSKLIFETIS